MINNVSVILVRSIYATNVGAVSRVMTNMGFGRLILLNPKCTIGVEARKGAATGQRPLEERVEYGSWDEFYAHEGEGLRIGFSARDGRLRQLCDFNSLLVKLNSTPEYDELLSKHTYLIFGPEDCGLSDADLEFAHYTSKLPIFGENQSLNLSHAVLLALYMFADLFSKSLNVTAEPKQLTTTPLKFPEATIRQWLETLNFNLDDRRISAYTTLKRMLLHNVPSEKELSVFESIVQQNIRKLKKCQSDSVANEDVE